MRFPKCFRGSPVYGRQFYEAESDRRAPGRDIVPYYLQIIQALSERDLLASRRIVDIGCGAGGFLRAVADAPARPAFVAGADLSMKQLKLARASVQNLVQCDLASLPFADSSVDVIVANEVVEHVREPAVVFREIARCLRSGGLAAITLPHDRNFFFSMLWIGALRAAFYDCGHLHTFTSWDQLSSFVNPGLRFLAVMPVRLRSPFMRGPLVHVRSLLNRVGLTSNIEASPAAGKPLPRAVGRIALLWQRVASLELVTHQVFMLQKS